MASDLENDEIEVVKREEIRVTRQVIHLKSASFLFHVLSSMLETMRAGKFTGHIKIQMNQGGVKSLDTEQQEHGITKKEQRA